MRRMRSGDEVALARKNYGVNSKRKRITPHPPPNFLYPSSIDFVGIDFTKSEKSRFTDCKISGARVGVGMLRVFLVLWFYGFVVLWFYVFKKLTKSTFHVFQEDIDPISMISKNFSAEIHHLLVPVFSNSGPTFRKFRFPFFEIYKNNISEKVSIILIFKSIFGIFKSMNKGSPGLKKL